MCDKRDRAITCVFCRDLHLKLKFPGLYKNICLKESEVWRKVVSNKIRLKTARDDEKIVTHDSVNIFFKLSLTNLP